MKNILITALIVTNSLAFSQDYLDKIAKKTCECSENIDQEKGSKYRNQQMGLCMINAAQPFEKKIKKDFGFELDNFDTDGKKFALIVFGKVIETCPNFMMNELDKPKDKKENGGYYLKEDFNQNERGWIEEKTDFHSLEIVSGYYHITSIDTSSSRTSSGSRDQSYLYNLPNNYSISCKIEFEDSQLDTAFCGILLVSATIEIKIHVPEIGQIKVDTYNYSTKRNGYYEMENPEINTKLKDVNIEIEISEWSFDLKVNGEYIGGGLMEAKTWDSIRPFAGKSTAVKVDYLYIK